MLGLVDVAKWAAQMTEGIQNEALADVLYWLIVVVIVSVVIGGIGFGVYVGARKVREIYLECCCDRVSVMMATISLAVAVYFGEEIRAVVPVNLIVWMLIVHGAYIGVRWYVKGWREARGIGRMRSFELLRILVCKNEEEYGRIRETTIIRHTVCSEFATHCVLY